jgi:hypothetical protein
MIARQIAHSRPLRVFDASAAERPPPSWLAKRYEVLSNTKWRAKREALAPEKGPG